MAAGPDRSTRCRRLIDINGDGRADWVLDRGKMHCEGRNLCPDRFCGVEIYLWHADGDWHLLLHQIVAELAQPPGRRQARA